MTCIQASPEVQYPKPKHEKEPFWTGGGSGCRTLVKKGSFSCLTTDSAGALGNSGIKSVKE